MATAARLRKGETLGDLVIKVDHAGEHGAVCIYTAQRWFARWRAPDLVDELSHFRDHERGHRALFSAVLADRGLRRCRSYHFCAVGGLVLGGITGLLGRQAIAATTVAVERVVLRHLREQVAAHRHKRDRCASPDYPRGRRTPRPLGGSLGCELAVGKDYRPHSCRFNGSRDLVGNAPVSRMAAFDPKRTLANTRRTTRPSASRS